MKAINKMSIRTKILSSFIVITVLLLIVSALVGSAMGTIDVTYSDLLNNDAFSQGIAGEALASFCLIDEYFHDGISFEDAELREEALAEVDVYKADFEAYMKELKSLMLESNQIGEDEFVNEVEKYNEIMTLYGQYCAVLDEIIAQIGQVETAEIQAMLVEKVDPIYDPLYDGVFEMINIKQQAATYGSQHATLRTNVTEYFMYGCILFVGVIAIVYGIVLSRLIANPLKTCAERLEKLAEGDIDSEVPVVKSKDETGMVYEATNKITENLKTIVTDQGNILSEIAQGNLNVESEHPDAYVGGFKPLLSSLETIVVDLTDAMYQIYQGSEQVANGADQVASGAQALSQGATEQASSVEELSATIVEI
ncbi:MAG: MCP four helix bundle domain-containing protein, partial [Clostridia bacterium]|nr:MCP four helix bundle domain-containing protein [Clostridia bacterium]